MKERPILFSAPMVLALLEGRKTQTRRVADLGGHLPEDIRRAHEQRCPYGRPGDRLWVREAFVYRDKHDRFYYRADHPVYAPYAHNGWKPSIHMPRRASRITLEITDVRLQRLKDITAGDCEAEGIQNTPNVPRDTIAWAIWHVESFRDLWDSLNADRAPWKSNPWVWAITFTTHRKEAP